MTPERAAFAASSALGLVLSMAAHTLSPPLKSALPDADVLISAVSAALGIAVALRVRGQGSARWAAMAGWVFGGLCFAIPGGDLVVDSAGGWREGTLVRVADVGLLAQSFLAPAGASPERVPLLARLLVVFGAIHTAIWLPVAAVTIADDRLGIDDDLLLIALIPAIVLGVALAVAGSVVGGSLDRRQQGIAAVACGIAVLLALPPGAWKEILSPRSEIRALALVPPSAAAIALCGVWLRHRIAAVRARARES